MCSHGSSPLCDVCNHHHHQGVACSICGHVGKAAVLSVPWHKDLFTTCPALPERPSIKDAPLAEFAEYLDLVEPQMKQPLGDVELGSGFTWLVSACNNCRFDVVQLLLERGASVDSSENGWTPLMWACRHGHEGHERIVQLLCSYGASRTRLDHQGRNAAAIARIREHSAHIGVWLDATELWSTPLHYIDVLTPARARALLRAGVHPHARARPDAPSPLELAQQIRPGVPGAAVARLVEQAAAPWSPETHALWPAAARARAADLLRLGYLLAYQREDEAGSVRDVWLLRVMPYALERSSNDQ